MMRTKLQHWITPVAALGVLLIAGLAGAQITLEQANQALLQQLERSHHLSAEQMVTIRAIFAESGFIGQGNPRISQHPVSPEQCQARIAELGVDYQNQSFGQICGAPYMAPLYDPSIHSAAEAEVCIDQFEFPDIPCTYPVVWVRAREAALLCEAVGKRLCDAHEWEGACAGRLEPPDYRFDLASGKDPATAIRQMREANNRAYTKVWSYGPTYRNGICAAASHKSPGCEGGGWTNCGSNTYPTGFFPDCRSPLGVYDLHGNAAEHMNLPLDASQMASLGSTELGYTEMKGSWFIFDSYKAHEDACGWRAPYWHGSRVMDRNSHHNYHLGFRCCKNIEPGQSIAAVTTESGAPLQSD